ncbi:MAG TPA: ABC transporter permease subunit [Verrucomicrobiae bacterium]|nr:ABC transporter permease subunit [Verrucomicrobiae bacterium]
MNTVLALAGVVIKEMYRRKDFYVLFVLTALLTLLTGSTTFFNDDKIVGYLKEICLLLIWVATLVIALTTSARQIPAERESRTIFPLLAKPVTRLQVVLGKFFGCWLVAGFTIVLFYIFFGVVTGAREHHWPWLQYVQAAWLHWMMLGVVIGMSLLGSLVFSAPSVNVTIMFIIVGGILTLGEHLHKVALRMTEPSQSILSALYFLIPHVEWAFKFRDLILFDQPLIPWSAVGVATVYWGAYTAALLLAAWLVFRRKTLTLG